MGSQGGEDSLCCGGTETSGMWDKRGRQSDRWQALRPHIRTDKPRGPDSEWWRTGQAERWVLPRGPTLADERQGAKQTAQPRAPARGWGVGGWGGNKTSDL